MSLKRFLSTFPPLALALTIGLLAVQPAVAEDDEEEEPNLMSQLLGAAGVIQLPGKGIDYQERPPLVVPPSTTAVQPQAAPIPAAAPNDPWNFNATSQNVSADPAPNPNPALVLPPPVDASTARARNPNFPVNPETKTAAKRKKTAAKRSRFFSDDPFYNGRTLRPDELRSPGPVSAERGPVDPNVTPSDNAQSTVQELNVPVIGKLFGKFREKEKPMVFTGEPERVELTQPPSGYLTPSPNAPYGGVEKDKPNYEVRGPSNSPNINQIPR